MIGAHDPLAAARGRGSLLFGLAVALLMIAGCAEQAREGGESGLQLTSPAFQEGGEIPSEHTCDGADTSLPLAWTGLPEGTAELALVLDDPDARGFVHWVVVGIPPDVGRLEAGQLPEDAREGRNNFGGTGYRGPCPPSGDHRYVITLYALSAALQVSDTPTAEEVRNGAAGVTLAEARLSATYGRR